MGEIDETTRRLKESLLIGTKIPDVTEMMANAGRAMDHRLGGRPRVPEDEKRRAVNVSLSREAITQLNDWIHSTQKSRSELLDSLIRTTAMQPQWPEEISGVPVTAGPLSEAELQTVATVANQALQTWALEPANRTREEIADAVKTFYAAATQAVRANR